VHQIPANANKGRSSLNANQVQTFLPVTGSAGVGWHAEAGHWDDAAILRLHPRAPVHNLE
jgi:hypothetical protein